MPLTPSTVSISTMYKDFEKTKSYHSSFVNAKFTGTSFRAAHMKYCNFTGCIFQGVDFVGTNLRGSNFKNAIFKECIFVAAVLDKVNFKDAEFTREVIRCGEKQRNKHESSLSR